MEVGRNLLSSPPSFPPRTHFRNNYSSSSPASASASTSGPAVTSVPTTSIAQRFSASVLLQEQRDELRPMLRLTKEEKTSQGMLDRRKNESGSLVHEDKSHAETNRQKWEFEHPSIHWPSFWHVFPSSQTKMDSSAALTMELTTAGGKKTLNVGLCDAIALAKKALEASKEAALLVEDSKLVGADSDDMVSLSLAGKEDKTVRSTRLIERRSKKRNVPKSKILSNENHSFRHADVRKNSSFDSDDPLRLFLASSETKQLLTFEEEFELIARVQDLMKLEQVKERLQSEFGREPTLVEWAEAVGIHYRILRTQICSGTSSREKLICSNLRMVVHIAKQYQGRGVGLQDLMQEGSKGLMKSVEKFKPQAGCRFASYAYWWIRQSIRKAIFQHSRTIRLPENMYTLLGKVSEAKRSCIEVGNHSPSKEDLARHAGITVERLQKLLYITRTPLSLQQPVWADQKTTFQEVTADSGTEIPDVSVSKQMMRRHLHGLIRSLNVREQQIIRLRFGIGGATRKSLSEIGNMYGLSKERVRQLESRALYKLKQCLVSHDLDAYSDLLV
ncbi:RNA polymerase sigma factor sigF, chloroplastic [Cannabis sativa]|uniref:RNA polymerase sigma factor sigF, chloroplastic n=1 Tax=Cannabis sativa TaxID=3483 RepID=UPI0029CA8B9B|nr:RNA polymerase sigma factor sigF, chloroplastic [Cannabis sativa]